jgi:predicted transcriptional regulator
MAGDETPLERGDRIAAKALMLEILADQPEDSSYDELLRQLAFHRLIARGVHDGEEGRLIATEDLKARMRSWRD